MKNLKFLFAILLFSSCAFNACDKDNSIDNQDEELITTVKLTFTEVGGGTSEFTVKDLDGDGGEPPVADEITLKAKTSYTIGVAFLDESEVDHTHDITEEVQAESNDHLVCFEASGALPVPVIGDLDRAGKPLGLESAIETGDVGSGSLHVILKHLPNKDDAAPCDTGDTDVAVTFSVAVQ